MINELRSTTNTSITKTPPSKANLNNMVFIQGGTFQMGSEDGSFDETPVHSVTVSDFYMGRYEVTFEEFSSFINKTGYKTDAEKDGWSRIWTGSAWEKKNGVDWRSDATGQARSAKDNKHPVLHVSWYDAIAYCNWKSEKDGFQKVYTINGTSVTANWNANGYRLPTEAEWEFAARSRGKDQKWAGTSSETQLSTYANGSGETDGFEYTAPVGSFQANDLGLYDLSGNVYEWCWDWYDDYAKNASTNPKGPNTGAYRVVRGGSWGSRPANLRCAYRDNSTPAGRNRYIGFRLSRAGS